MRRCPASRGRIPAQGAEEKQRLGYFDRTVITDPKVVKALGALGYFEIKPGKMKRCEALALQEGICRGQAPDWQGGRAYTAGAGRFVERGVFVTKRYLGAGALGAISRCSPRAARGLTEEGARRQRTVGAQSIASGVSDKTLSAETV